METMEKPHSMDLEARRKELLAQIDERRRIYDAYSKIPKDQFTNEEDVTAWNNAAQELENLRLELAKVDIKIQENR